MYEITITKVVNVKRTERGATVEVGEIQDPTMHNGLKTKWEYLPDRVSEVSEEKEIYKQTVDELDLVAVINAVNGGKP